MKKGIPEEKVMQFIRNLMKFPYPTICRHLVAADLLSALEEQGITIDPDLAEAVVGCDDDKALELLG